jgi:hypothetical protein
MNITGAAAMIAGGSGSYTAVTSGPVAIPLDEKRRDSFILLLKPHLVDLLPPEVPELYLKCHCI